MDKAEVDNPIARIGVDLLVGTAATSGALDVRGIYRLGFHRSAKIAESRVDDFVANFDKYLKEKEISKSLLKNIESSDNIVFTIGGAGDTTQNQAKLIAAGLHRSKNKELESFTFFPFAERKIFAADLTKEDTELTALGKTGREYTKATFKNFQHPDAVSLAIQVAAIKKMYPEKEISLMGYCGGGLIAREASEILKVMGVKTKNNITIASPFAGMTSAQEFTNIISHNDVYLNFLKPRNNFYLDTVADHMKYFDDPFLMKIMGKMLNGKSVNTEDFNLFNEFTEITKGLDSMYIYKRLNIQFDDLSKIASNFIGVEKSISPTDYIKGVKKVDKEINDINRKKNEIKTMLDSVESRLLENPDTEKATLKLFVEMRKNYENGINTFMENMYKEKFLHFEYNKFLKQIASTDVSTPELKEKAIKDFDRTIPLIEDFIKNLDGIIAKQEEESYLSFANYTKQKLKEYNSNNMFSASMSAIGKKINL